VDFPGGGSTHPARVSAGNWPAHKKVRFRVLRIGGKTLLNRSEVEKYAPEQPGRPRK
jgi:hypothetical protein